MLAFLCFIAVFVDQFSLLRAGKRRKFLYGIYIIHHRIMKQAVLTFAPIPAHARRACG